MVKALIFDCFGVLYVDASHDFYQRQVPHYAALRPQLLELNRASDYGLITQAEWVSQVAEVTGLSPEHVRKNIQGTQVRNQALLEYTQRLRRDYRLGMLSNIGMGAMDTFFSPSDRQQLFDAVVLSSEVGLTKPHPEIFHIMASRLGCEVGECVMIDDLEENCAGADAAGMRAVQYVSNAQIMDDLRALLEAENA